VRILAQSILCMALAMAGCGFVSLSQWSPSSMSELTYQSRPPLSDKAAVIPPALLGAIRQRTAVVIGIGKYADAGPDRLGNLNYASADADAFAVHLLNSGFDKVKVLIDEKATLVQIRTAIRLAIRGAQEDDLVVISWAGHCCPDPGNSGDLCLLAYDSSMSNLSGTAYALTDFRQDIVMGKSLRLFVILDTCYAGAIGGAGRAAPAPAGPSPDMLMAMRGVYVAPSAGDGAASGPSTAASRPNWAAGGDRALMRLVFAASQGGEPSLEARDLGHGVFSYYLLKGLQGDADAKENGGDGNSVVTLGEAIAYTRKMVRQYSRQRQNPDIAGTYDSTVPMGVVPK
jgi:uncharacterized caspase-like protein